MKISQLEVAKILEVSLSGFKLWLEEGMPGKVKRNDYDLAAIVAWVRRNKPLREAGENLTALRAENLRLKNDLLRTEGLVQSGGLIPRETILSEFLTRIQYVKTGLLMLPRLLPRRLNGKDPREAGAIIKKAVIDLLNRYSRPSGLLRKK